MAETAVIFDVDGVLLELTDPKPPPSFIPSRRSMASPDCPTTGTATGSATTATSWRRFSRTTSGGRHMETETGTLVERYIAHLAEGLKSGRLKPAPISGASELLAELHGAGHAVGIATSNLLAAARMRLQHQGLWERVKAHSFGAEPGGPKARNPRSRHSEHRNCRASASSMSVTT